MIRSFGDDETERIWRGERSRRLPYDIQAVGRRKLGYLDQARRLGDLAVPPGNRLEALTSDRQGQHSIRITISGESASCGGMAMPARSRSSTITEPTDRLPNPHPGEILIEDFLRPMGLSQTRLARDIGVPPRRINEIVLGKRSVTADTDLRLARYFGLSEGIWLGLQAAYDLEHRRLELGDRLEREVRRGAA